MLHEINMVIPKALCLYDTSVYIQRFQHRTHFENNVVGCSCVTKEVAARAIQMLNLLLHTIPEWY